jgi:hypothetical protein
MPDFCTCGAQLPPDALFCHKCGKPQREIVEVEPQTPPAALEPAPSAFATPVLSALPALFQSRLAMNIGLRVALGATLFFFLPYVNWLGAGFFSVFLYRRRTGQRVNMESGVRIGWITGLLMFAIMALLLTATIVMFNTFGGVAAFQAQFKNSIDPKVVSALQSLQSASGVAEMLIQLFVAINLLSMAGGAIGAMMPQRVSGRRA